MKSVAITIVDDMSYMRKRKVKVHVCAPDRGLLNRELTIAAYVKDGSTTWPGNDTWRLIGDWEAPRASLDAVITCAIAWCGSDGEAEPAFPGRRLL